MRVAAFATAILLLGSLATASQIEDLTGIHYQHDAGIPGDAPDTCEDADESRTLNEDGEAFVQLVEIDDESDVIVVDYLPEELGNRMQIRVEALVEDIGISLRAYQIDVLAPDCTFSILDPEAPVYTEPPNTPPENPVTAEPGETVVSGDVSKEYDCNPFEWKFMAKVGKGVSPPDELYVEWTDGSHEYIQTEKASEGQVAQWMTSQNLDYSLAKIVAAFQGSGPAGFFMVVHGPCDAEAWEPPAGPAQPSPDVAEFTVAIAGKHRVVISILEDIVEHGLGGLGARNIDCHDRDCKAAFTPIGADIIEDNIDIFA